MTFVNLIVSTNRDLMGSNFSTHCTNIMQLQKSFIISHELEIRISWLLACPR